MEVYEQQRKPASSRGMEFLKGFAEGAFNSALVTGLFNGVATAAGLLGLIVPLMPLAYIPVLAISIGAFSGIMSVRRVMHEDKETARVSRDLRKEIESLSLARAQEQSVDAGELEAANDELSPSARWSDRFTRQQRASLRLQNILEKRVEDDERAENHVEALLEKRAREAQLAEKNSQR